MRLYDTPESRLARIDEIFAQIKESMAKPAFEDWKPTETHPVRRRHEIELHNQRLDNMARQIRLSGGSTRENYGYYQET